MAKKKKVKITDGPTPTVILNAHAGQRGPKMGTYITYIKDGITRQGFYEWETSEFYVVIEDLQRVVR